MLRASRKVLPPLTGGKAHPPQERRIHPKKDPDPHRKQGKENRKEEGEQRESDVEADGGGGATEQREAIITHKHVNSEGQAEDRTATATTYSHAARTATATLHSPATAPYIYMLITRDARGTCVR